MARPVRGRRARPRIVDALDAAPILAQAWRPGEPRRTAALWLDGRGYAVELCLGDFPVVYGVSGDAIDIDDSIICMTSDLEGGVVPPGGVALRMPLPPDDDRIVGVLLASLGGTHALPGTSELSAWPRIVRNYRDMGIGVADWLLLTGDIVVSMAELRPDPIAPSPASP